MDDRHDVESKLAIMISSIVSVFVVCNSFESIVFILSSQEILSLNIVQDYLRPFADFLMIINSSVNVIIFCIFKKEFRNKFFQMYVQCNWKRKSKPKPLPAPVEISMIAMMRAQLPKTSVEMTSAEASKEFSNYKGVGPKSIPLIGARVITIYYILSHSFTFCRNLL